MGICSRSQAAAMIQAGRVRLNGVVKRNPEAPVHFGADCIEVDGRVRLAAENLYWMLNKPRGAVTTAAAMFHREDLPASGKIVAVVSGGNIEPQLFSDILTRTA